MAPGSARAWGRPPAVGTWLTVLLAVGRAGLGFLILTTVAFWNVGGCWGGRSRPGVRGRLSGIRVFGLTCGGKDRCMVSQTHVVGVVTGVAEAQPEQNRDSGRTEHRPRPDPAQGLPMSEVRGQEPRGHPELGLTGWGAQGASLWARDPPSSTRIKRCRAEGVEGSAQNLRPRQAARRQSCPAPGSEPDTNSASACGRPFGPCQPRRPVVTSSGLLFPASEEDQAKG